MAPRLRRLAKDVVGYGLGTAVHRAFSIVIPFIYLRLLSQADYGRLDVVFSTTAVLSYLLSLGIEIGLPRLYYEHEDPARRRRLTASAFYAVTGFTLGVIALLLALAGPAARLLYGESRAPVYTAYLQIVLVTMPFLHVHGVQLLVLRLRQQIGRYNVLAVVNLVLTALFSIAAALGFGLGTAAVLWGTLIAYVITATIGVAWNWSELWHRPTGSGLHAMLALGFPVALAGLATWALNFVDRLFLVRWVPDTDLGLYGLANGLAGLLSVFLVAFQNAWSPFAFSVMGQQGDRFVYARTLTFLTIIGGGFAAALGLGAPEMLAVVNLISGKPYQAAAPNVGPLALGMLFSSMYVVVQTGAHITKNTRLIALTTGLAAVANIALNLWWIPLYGIYGSSLATAAGYAVSLVAIYVLAERQAHIPYERGKVLVTLALTVGLIALAPFVRTGALWSDVLAKLGLGLLYLAALVAARVVTRDEIARLLRSLRPAGENAA